MNPLKARIANLTDDQIKQCVRFLNVDRLLPAERMVRVLSLAEYENRHGAAAVDALMDELEATERPRGEPMPVLASLPPAAAAI